MARQLPICSNCPHIVMLSFLDFDFVTLMRQGFRARISKLWLRKKSTYELKIMALGCIMNINIIIWFTFLNQIPLNTTSSIFFKYSNLFKCGKKKKNYTNKCILTSIYGNTRIGSIPFISTYDYRISFCKVQRPY